MDGATLTIAFRDDSSQAQGSPGNAPPGGGNTPAYNQVDEQQRAITQAGGVRNLAEQQYSQATTTATASVNPAAIAQETTVSPAVPTPTPIATAGTPSNVPPDVSASIRSIHANGATIEELARLFQRSQSDIQSIVNPTPPAAQPIPTAPATPSNTQPATPAEYDNTQTLIRRERRLRSEAEDNERQAREAQAQRNSQFDEELQTLIRRERRGQTEERGRIQAAEDESEQRRATGQQVQTTVNAISHFAHMAGPLGSATAGVVNSAVAIPAVAEALGAAAPGLVAAAPYVGLAVAAAAIPAAIGAAAINEANRAIAVSRNYSPEAVGAEAIAGVRQLQADLRSSQRLGDEAALIIEARSRASTAFQGIRDKLSEGPLKDLGNIANVFANAAEAANNILDRFDKAAPGATNSITRYGTARALDGLFPGLGSLYEIISGIGSILPQKKDEWTAAAGLIGIIPKTPDLPYPFTGSTNSEKIEVHASGLPPALRGITANAF